LKYSLITTSDKRIEIKGESNNLEVYQNSSGKLLTFQKGIISPNNPGTLTSMHYSRENSIPIWVMGGRAISILDKADYSIVNEYQDFWPEQGYTPKLICTVDDKSQIFGYSKKGTASKLTILATDNSGHNHTIKQFEIPDNNDWVGMDITKDNSNLVIACAAVKKEEFSLIAFNIKSKKLGKIAEMIFEENYGQFMKKMNHLDYFIVGCRNSLYIIELVSQSTDSFNFNVVKKCPGITNSAIHRIEYLSNYFIILPESNKEKIKCIRFFEAPQKAIQTPSFLSPRVNRSFSMSLEKIPGINKIAVSMDGLYIYYGGLDGCIVYKRESEDSTDFKIVKRHSHSYYSIWPTASGQIICQLYESNNLAIMDKEMTQEYFLKGDPVVGDKIYKEPHFLPPSGISPDKIYWFNGLDSISIVTLPTFSITRLRGLLPAIPSLEPTHILSSSPSLTSPLLLISALSPSQEQYVTYLSSASVCATLPLHSTPSQLERVVFVGLSKELALVAVGQNSRVEVVRGIRDFKEAGCLCPGEGHVTCAADAGNGQILLGRAQEVVWALVAEGEAGKKKGQVGVRSEVLAKAPRNEMEVAAIAVRNGWAWIRWMERAQQDGGNDILQAIRLD